MDELEQTLQRVLSNPEEMAKISRIAAQLFANGGGQEETAEGNSAPDPTGPGPAELLKGLLSASPGADGGSGGGSGDKTALLNAIAPYLREDRRRKLQKAMRLARAARLAGVMLTEFGGEGDGL